MTNSATLAPFCIHPSLSMGEMHVVIAAHRKTQWSDHYVWFSGLTNASFYIYCRQKECLPLRTEDKFCNVKASERLLLPNVGRDSAVFFDYALSVYDNPPSVVAFLHDHIANSRHSSCESVFGRLRSYYQGITGVEPRHFQNIMISLNDRNWYGRKESIILDNICSGRSLLRLTIRQQERKFGSRISTMCRNILKKWNVTILDRPYYHCCASFVLPGLRVQKFPRGFYEDMLQYHLEEHHDQLTSRTCFEHLVYRLFGDELGCRQLRELELFYRQADNLERSADTNKQFIEHCRLWSDHNLRPS